MFFKKVYDLPPIYKESGLSLDGYATQKTGTGYSLKNKNKLNPMKPDIQVKLDRINNNVTITANSIPKLLPLIGIIWAIAMVSLFAVFFVTGEFAYALKFWFGVIIGAWVVIPTSAVVLFVLFRKKMKPIFDDIYAQLK